MLAPGKSAIRSLFLSGCPGPVAHLPGAPAPPRSPARGAVHLLGRGSGPGPPKKTAGTFRHAPGPGLAPSAAGQPSRSVPRAVNLASPRLHRTPAPPRGPISNRARGPSRPFCGDTMAYLADFSPEATCAVMSVQAPWTSAKESPPFWSFPFSFSSFFLGSAGGRGVFRVLPRGKPLPRLPGPPFWLSFWLATTLLSYFRPAQWGRRHSCGRRRRRGPGAVHQAVASPWKPACSWTANEQLGHPSGIRCQFRQGPRVSKPQQAAYNTKKASSNRTRGCASRADRRAGVSYAPRSGRSAQGQMPQLLRVPSARSAQLFPCSYVGTNTAEPGVDETRPGQGPTGVPADVHERGRGWLLVCPMPRPGSFNRCSLTCHPGGRNYGGWTPQTFCWPGITAW